MVRTSKLSNICTKILRQSDNYLVVGWLLFWDTVYIQKLYTADIYAKQFGILYTHLCTND